MDDCIIFKGHKNEAGYGRIKLNGRKVYAHRLKYCESKGISLSDISGKIVRHKCDNPSCINPAHLILGSQKQNMEDMVSRGRSLCGDRHKQAKLSKSQVEFIRKKYIPFDRKLGAKPLAKLMGVSKGTVSRILMGVLWRS